MHRGALVLVITLAVGMGASAAGGPCSAATRPAAWTPVVLGYPYARSCPGAGIADVVDRWGMYACNCTSYVAWALAANNQRVDWFIAGAMNAWNWPHVARLAALRVDRRPAPGTVAVWPSLAPPFGHVAYVTGVNRDGTIDVAEYNYPGPGGANTFTFDVRSLVSTSGATFIHVPRVAQRPSALKSSPRR
jgi:surface antigen